MRSILAVGLTLLFSVPAMAQSYPFADRLKASLVFHEEPDALEKYGYPHVLLVTVHLKNVGNHELRWSADPLDIKAELLDSKGHPVQQGPSFASITSSCEEYSLSSGASLDWLISNGGISMGDGKDQYALMVGGEGWLIPMKTVETYSLHVRIPLFGIDIYPTKIKISHPHNQSVQPGCDSKRVRQGRLSLSAKGAAPYQPGSERSRGPGFCVPLVQGLKDVQGLKGYQPAT